MVEKERKFLCEEGKDELRFVKDLVAFAKKKKKLAWEELAWDLTLKIWADSLDEADKILIYAPRFINRIRRKKPMI